MKIHIIWYNSCIRIKCLLFCILSVMYSTLTIRVYWVNLDIKKKNITPEMFCSIWTLYCILHLKQNLPSIFTFDVILLWEVNSCLIHVHMAVLVIINIWLMYVSNKGCSNQHDITFHNSCYMLNMYGIVVKH